MISVRQLRSSPRYWLAAVYIAALAGIFVSVRTFWTPDILFLALFGFFLILEQGKRFIVYFLPFVVLLLSYEKLRSLAPRLNQHVHYLTMIRFDTRLFGGHLPTAWLQQHWYAGHAMWYDFYFYFLYMLHFVAPIVLAVAVWKFRPRNYWTYVTALVVLSYGAFITYVLFPAAPPWLASSKGLIAPIHRISSDVWTILGVKNFSTYYEQLTPNIVAAVPSLHAAYPLLFSLVIGKNWGKRWFWLSLLYPVSVWVGVVYLGEHYVMDVLLGIVYALVSFWAAPYIIPIIRLLIKKVGGKYPESISRWIHD
ncbi:phosphatase PAP2 family protein [Candidatus Saccharibacteria bacterium]|nr:phosphatase PAP2 family protein [Candidatus Saccharibacteria bacterium]